MLEQVERGAFAAEALRKQWNDISPTERKLTATLVYATLRKHGLWRHLLTKYCKRPLEALHPQTRGALTMGIAGVLELKHFKPGVLVNAIVQQVKQYRRGAEAFGEHAVVNAVLHTVIDQAPAYISKLRTSPALRDQALAHGVPGWVAAEWNKERGMKETKRLLQLAEAPAWMALRAAPGVDRKLWADSFAALASLPSAPSDFMQNAIRIEGNPYPHDLPGYREGQVTPQSESSMWAVENLLAYWQEGPLLDMCMGRGVKSGHILTARTDAQIEGWDLSVARVQAAQRELGRLGVGGRIRTQTGDALTLSPQVRPAAILLDAPCSGSGTWGRHPEGKWRTTPAKLQKAADLQKKLFSRAADLLAPGGILAYCTCSLFKSENEHAVGEALASREDMVELPTKVGKEILCRGRPYGSTVMPESPWIDGFYIAIFRKKS